MCFYLKLFSNSVATGLCYYRQCGATGFELSEDTEDFTRSMNNVFDALNCKVPNEGVRIGGKYYNVNMLYSSHSIISFYAV